MSDITRRNFFKQAGTAAVAVGAVAIAPGMITPTSAATAGDPLSVDEVSRSEPIVAHLTDPGAGRVTLFIGTREVQIQDRVVAARIVRAAR